MGDTLAQIATACARYGFGGTDDIARLKAFINETYRDLFYRQKWTWAENITTITLNAGASSATVPSGSYQYGEIRKVTSPSTYPYEPPKFTEYADDSHGAFNRFAVTVVGAPEFYTIFAGTIYFDRIADTQYQYEFYRWNEPTALTDNDEPVIPQYGREVLQWGALMRQALHDHDENAYARYAALFEEKAQQLKEADIQGRPKNRSRMPAEYGRAYD